MSKTGSRQQGFDRAIGDLRDEIGSTTSELTELRDELQSWLDNILSDLEGVDIPDVEFPGMMG